MRLRTLAAGMAALALALTACGDDSDDAGGGGSSASSVVDKAKNDKKLVVGIKYDQPGLGLRSADGSFSGFDVEMAKYIAKELGVEESGIEWKETVSSNREPFIQQGQVDMVVATYSITDARKEKVSFAGPYFVAGQSLLVRSDNTDITGAESLNNNKKLCSVSGSTPAKKIKDEYAKDVQLQEFDSYSKCIDALLGGQVDAVTTDDIILAGFAAAEPRQAQGGRQAVQHREVRRGPEEGRQGRSGRGQRGDREGVHATAPGRPRSRRPSARRATRCRRPRRASRSTDRAVTRGTPPSVPRRDPCPSGEGSGMEALLDIPRRTCSPASG